VLINNMLAAATSWFVAFIAILGEHRDNMMYVLGLLLVLARLAQEIPKAIKSVKEWFKSNE
jgi:hypothetical protein